jgi:2'-5' RNA ligase
LRLFVGAELPEPVRAALGAVALGEGWRPVPVQSLHVTLSFLGEVADPAPVVEALRPVSGAPVAAVLGDAVLLPPRRPRVYAVRVVSEGLVALQAAVAGALVKAGVHEPETRPFLPHVTIGRARGRVPRGARPSTPAALRFDITSFALFRSEPHSRYTPLLRSSLET